jgi:beta-barrel assembly-enhancing protease
LLDKPSPPEFAAREAALQALADKVAARMDLPVGMRVRLRFDDSSQVNAYATIGGRISVFRGLLGRLKSEDALAALLAHEIAHVRHRHVAANAGRGVALALLLGMLSADAGAAVAEAALGQAAGLALLGYSREQEAQSDHAALRAVVALYGHAAGMKELFTQLGEATAGAVHSVQVLSSHPLTEVRLSTVLARARESGWRVSGPLTPLPAALVLPPNPK